MEQQQIGWQPVYGQSPPPPRQTGGASLILWGVCLTVLIGALSSSGFLLWGKTQKTEAEIQRATYEAVMSERSRINECVQQIPMQGERPRMETTKANGSNQLR